MNSFPCGGVRKTDRAGRSSSRHRWRGTSTPGARRASRQRMAGIKATRAATWASPAGTPNGRVEPNGTIPTGRTLNKAYGVNASGQVAGWGNGSAGERSYRYNAGTNTTLGPITGNYSYGQAVNLNGLVVGTSSTKNGTNPGFHATLWSGSTV